MSKRHFLLYDFLLPILGLLATGILLSRQFDSTVFRWFDSLKVFEIGSWFSHSPIRETLWTWSHLVFAAPAAILWLAWVNINIEYDYVNRGRKLDRPLFKFVRGLLRWIEGGNAGAWQAQAAQFRLAQSEDRARRLEVELMKTRQAYAELEADFRALEEETSTFEEMEDVGAADEPAAASYSPRGYQSEPAPVPQPTLSAERLARLADL